MPPYFVKVHNCFANNYVIYTHTVYSWIQSTHGLCTRYIDICSLFDHLFSQIFDQTLRVLPAPVARVSVCFLLRLTLVMAPDTADLRNTALRLAAKGKGLLASDESVGTIGKRLGKAGIANTEVPERG